MSKPTVKELADKLEANPRLLAETVARRLLLSSELRRVTTNDPDKWNAACNKCAADDAEALDLLFPPEPKAEPWTPLIITFRKNKDGQWEGQILSQDERDRVGGDVGSEIVGTYAGVSFASRNHPDCVSCGSIAVVLYLRGKDRSLDLKWFFVDSEAVKRKIQAAVRELNNSRGIELAQ